MALTSHAILRDLILSELSDLGGQAPRPDVLAAIDATFGGAWTADDLSSPPSRPFETKWRNRASFERIGLIKDGLLVQRDDGIWALTAAGLDAANNVAFSSPSAWRGKEIARREAMWVALGGGQGPVSTTAQAIRDAGLFSGARGIYADKGATSSPWTPDGVAVSFLHTGHTYSDDLTSEGVLYHFPDTSVPGRDRADISATQAAFASGVPVFVISQESGSGGARVVHKAFVEETDTTGRIALITFTVDDVLPPPPPISESGIAFSLTTEDAGMIWTKRRARPNQTRFAFQVAQRYGAACAVCGLAVSDALEAAHIRAKSKLGSDDPRNGIMLCRNHHRMLDRDMFAIDPTDMKLAARGGGVTLESLQITKKDLSHLTALPHADALADAWVSWSKTNPDPTY